MTSKTAIMESNLKRNEETLRKAAGETGATLEDLAAAAGVDLKPQGDRHAFTRALNALGFGNRRVGTESGLKSLWHPSFIKATRNSKAGQAYSPCADKTQDHIWSDTGGGWDHCVKPGCGIFRRPDGSPMPK